MWTIGLGTGKRDVLVSPAKKRLQRELSKLWVSLAGGSRVYGVAGEQRQAGGVCHPVGQCLLSW